MMASAARIGLALTILHANATAERTIHAGLEARTDHRTHLVRVPFGILIDRIDVSIVLDPLVFADGLHDGDIVAEWSPPGWTTAFVGGWRVSAIRVATGTQWQHRSLVGIGRPLGEWHWLRARFGAEVSIHWVSHGGDLPTSWISFERDLIDRIQLGLFARVEYATAL